MKYLIIPFTIATIILVPLIILGCDDDTRQAIKQYRQNQRIGNVPG